MMEDSFIVTPGTAEEILELYKYYECSKDDLIINKQNLYNSLCDKDRNFQADSNNFYGIDITPGKYLNNLPNFVQFIEQSLFVSGRQQTETLNEIASCSNLKYKNSKAITESSDDKETIIQFCPSPSVFFEEVSVVDTESTANEGMHDTQSQEFKTDYGNTNPGYVTNLYTNFESSCHDKSDCSSVITQLDLKKKIVNFNCAFVDAVNHGHGANTIIPLDQGDLCYENEILDQYNTAELSSSFLELSIIDENDDSPINNKSDLVSILSASDENTNNDDSSINNKSGLISISSASDENVNCVDSLTNDKSRLASISSASFNFNSDSFISENSGTDIDIKKFEKRPCDDSDDKSPTFCNQILEDVINASYNIISSNETNNVKKLKTVEAIDEKKINEDEPIKEYKLPYTSNSKEENDDNNDPKWNILKLLNTDLERYRIVRQWWKSCIVPDPNVNLSLNAFKRKKLAKHVIKDRVFETSCKRRREIDNEYLPPSKRPRTFSCLKFNADDVEWTKYYIYQDYEELRRFYQWNNRIVCKMDKRFHEYQAQLNHSTSEVDALHSFYQGLPDQVQHYQRDIEMEHQNINEVYRAFSYVYNWNGRFFNPHCPGYSMPR